MLFGVGAALPKRVIEQEDKLRNGVREYGEVEKRKNDS